MLFGTGDNTKGQASVPVELGYGVVGFSGGGYHTLAVLEDGSVVGWGDNSYGQTNVPVEAKSGVIAVAAANTHSLALKGDGSVIGWGGNEQGQARVPESAKSGVVAISGGDQHSLALKADGSVIGWGVNNDGQITIPEGAQSGVKAISAGGYHNLVLKEDGTVVAWGNNWYGQIEVPGTIQGSVRAVSAGVFYSVALLKDGSVVAWGKNEYGQSTVPAGAKTNVVAIAAGGVHVAALKADGSVITWGLGNTATVPVFQGMSAIATGRFHTLGLKLLAAPVIRVAPVGKTVKEREPLWLAVGAEGLELKYQWYQDGVAIEGATGQVCHLGPAQKSHTGNYTVQVSNPVSTLPPTDPVTLTVTPNSYSGSVVDDVFLTNVYEHPPDSTRAGIVAVTVGATFDAALTVGGEMVVWNLLGPGVVPDILRTNVVGIYGGEYQLIGLRNDGTAGAVPASNPLPSEFQSGIAQFSVGLTHMLALKRDGTVIASGSNQYGETTVPDSVRTGVVAVVAANKFSMALKWDGTVVVWGWGGSIATQVPDIVQGKTIAIAGNYLNGVALLMDGSVVVWGGDPSSGSPKLGVVATGMNFITAGGYNYAFRGATGFVQVGGPIDVPFNAGPKDLTGLDSVSIGLSRFVELFTPTLPILTNAPTGGMWREGQRLALSAGAGGRLVDFQWSRDGLPIPDATNGIYTVAAVLKEQQGAYTVRLTNPAGSVESTPVQVTVVSRNPWPQPIGPGRLAVAGSDASGERTIPPGALDGVVAVAAGEAHVLALKDDGSTVAWGDNHLGQITIPPAARSRVRSIAAGANHCLALLEEGTVVGWGDDRLGQIDLPFLSKGSVVEIAAGDTYSVALLQDGSLVQWGAKLGGATNGAASDSKYFVGIAAGADHALALRGDGSVVSWGSDAHQLGSIPPEASTEVRAVAAGAYHSAVLKRNGAVVAWGDNSLGQTTVPSAAQSGVIAIAAGANHTVALKADHTVVVWGDARIGQDLLPAGRQGRFLFAGAGGNHSLWVYDPGPLSIVVPPVGGQWPVGDSISLQVVAGGVDIAFQWTKDGVDLPGAVGPMLNLGRARLDLSGDYAVRVSSAGKSVTSAPAARVDIVQPALLREGALFRFGPTPAQPLPPEADSGVIDVVRTPSNDVFLKSSGAVYVLGATNYGLTRVPLTARAGVVAIAGGTTHAVALKSDGSVVEWGAFADAVTGEVALPASLHQGVVAIAAGDGHALALKADGTVIAWGTNNLRQVEVPDSVQRRVVAIAAGRNHCVVLTRDGSVVAWGDSPAASPAPEVASVGVQRIAAAEGHTVVWKSDGTAWIWGDVGGSSMRLVGTEASNARSLLAGSGRYPFTYSALILGADRALSAQPASILDAIPVAQRTGVMAISGTPDSGVVLVPPIPIRWIQTPTNQAVFAGQSVVLNAVASGYPVRYQWQKDGLDIPGANQATLNLGPAQLDMGGRYSVVLSGPLGTLTTQTAAELVVNPSAGTVVVWTSDSYPQRYAVDQIPVEAQSGVIALSGGILHVLALRYDGSVVAWGAGTANGKTDLDVGQSQVPPEAKAGVVSVAAARYHSLAIKADGTVLGWGDPEDGKSKVPPQARSGGVAVSGGYRHSLVLRSDGSVVAWGYNGSGQTNVPDQARSDVVAIAAGGYHSLALRSDGSVVAWGANDVGQTRVPTSAQSGVVAIAAGDSHSLALRSDGSVVAWGDGSSGQTQVPPAARSGVASIAAAVDSSYAIKRNGTVVAWGDAPAGAIPARLPELTSLSGGYGFGVALLGSPFHLRMDRRDGVPNLAWSTNLSQYHPQVTSGLNGNPEWRDASGSPSIRGAQFVQPVPTDAAAGYFRLVTP